jgi:indole-3-glycerol phosphate synthase
MGAALLLNKNLSEQQLKELLALEHNLNMELLNDI